MLKSDFLTEHITSENTVDALGLKKLVDILNSPHSVETDLAIFFQDLSGTINFLYALNNTPTNEDADEDNKTLCAQALARPLLIFELTRQNYSILGLVKDLGSVRTEVYIIPEIEHYLENSKIWGFPINKRDFKELILQIESSLKNTDPEVDQDFKKTDAAPNSDPNFKNGIRCLETEYDFEMWYHENDNTALSSAPSP
jgi:hypothetical protein